MLRICSRFALVALLFLGTASFGVQALTTDFSGPVRVIDGDTLDVGSTRVRLFGIDAPERDQPCTTLQGQNWACGDWATRQVAERFAGKTAQCSLMDTDRYGRSVARCTVAGRDIGQDLVREGIAFAYLKYSDDYLAQEQAAEAAGRGIHGHVVESPARYRLTRIKGRDAPDPACRIKGNISKDSQRIYHLPGQAFYDKTSVNLKQGERWFCSEAQARASGWRKAQR